MMAQSAFQKGLRNAVYVAVIAIVLALSGIFTSFAEREVIADLLPLNSVVLVLFLVGGAFAAGWTARRTGGAAFWVASVAGGLIVGLALAALIILETSVDLTFVFPNLLNPLSETLAFGQGVPGGLLLLLGLSAALGAVTGALIRLPGRWRMVLVSALALTAILGLLENQIRQIVTIGDALAFALAFALGYGLNVRLNRTAPEARFVIGVLPGLVVGLVVTFVLLSAFPPDSALRTAAPALAVFALAFGGGAGGLASRGSRSFHDGMIYLCVGLLAIGVLHWQDGMTPLGAILIFALLLATSAFVAEQGERATIPYLALERPARRRETRLAFGALLIVLAAVPLLTGQYITNVLNLTGLYIVMGIGLNIVVGFAGLLDLGYVAFFAIGAYTVGILTTPSLLTCGGTPADALTADTVAQVCTGVMTFWQAWPIAVVVSALFGILLGIPVLRLRGDYLAIVTLGFGEIIRLIIKFDDFKPLFGSAQGIAAIPRPVIDLTALNPAWRFELTGEVGVYYLIIFSILLTAFIASRLAYSRLGRAWRAMRADEDVAQQMGINLTRTKLSAFAIGSAFAGMGGAIAATRLYGAYPDSFTILVSINVLCVIIIGGLGSIPGVVIGALVLVGLPEALRELSDYRLLAFGVLLVAAMILRPQGIIPPTVRRLSEIADDSERARGAGEVGV